MGSIDAVLITIISAVICIVLPKVLSVLLSVKTKLFQPGKKNFSLNTERLAITSFPYCTVYSVTGTQYCKFSPQFCSQCSPSQK
jgi:hypothetical protein